MEVKLAGIKELKQWQGVYRIIRKQRAKNSSRSAKERLYREGGAITIPAQNRTSSDGPPNGHMPRY